MLSGQAKPWLLFVDKVVRLINEGGLGYPLTDRTQELWRSEGVSLASSEERLPGGAVTAVAEAVARSLRGGDDLVKGPQSASDY